MALDGSKDAAFKYVGTRPERPDGFDKVTGRARFGADMTAPGMLFGAIVRSPHAHARIVRIDTSKAEALDGVKAIVTRADFTTKIQPEPGMAGELWNTLENVMAGEKALYDGHAVAAVAATSGLIARDAAKLIEVEYEILPHVTDVDAAMQEGAPVIREGAADYSVPAGMHPNVVRCHDQGHGDVEAGFAEADLIVEDSFTTEATHQGYIEPHACLATLGADGKGEIWCCTQGHWNVQKVCAALVDIETSQLARDRLRNRRRVWRQDHRLYRTSGARPVPQGEQAGQSCDVTRRSVPGDWTDRVDLDGYQDRHDQGWNHNCGQG